MKLRIKGDSLRLRVPKMFDLRAELYRIFGVDLTNGPGISVVTAQTILCEVGTDVSRFRNASAFASWLGLCPRKRSAAAKCFSPRVDACEAESQLRSTWVPSPSTMPKTTCALVFPRGTAFTDFLNHASDGATDVPAIFGQAHNSKRSASPERVRI
ncbi:MAG: transposase [Terracidiphilus sp.]